MASNIVNNRQKMLEVSHYALLQSIIGSSGKTSVLSYSNEHGVKEILHTLPNGTRSILGLFCDKRLSLQCIAGHFPSEIPVLDGFMPKEYRQLPLSFWDDLVLLNLTDDFWDNGSINRKGLRYLCLIIADIKDGRYDSYPTSYPTLF